MPDRNGTTPPTSGSTPDLRRLLDEVMDDLGITRQPPPFRTNPPKPGPAWDDIPVHANRAFGRG